MITGNDLVVCRLSIRRLVESGIASKYNGRMVKRGKRRKRVVQKPKRPLNCEVVKWYNAGLISQSPEFDSQPTQQGQQRKIDKAIMGLGTAPT